MNESGNPWSKAPAVQFYFKDWLDAKVLRMSDAAQGVYMRLLAHIWTGTADQYRIKINDKTLAKMLGLSARMWRKYRHEIQHENDPILAEVDGYYVSERLKKEKAKQVLRSKKASDAAKTRWMKEHYSEHAENDAQSNAQASSEQCSGDALQSSSSPSGFPPYPPSGKRRRRTKQERQRQREEGQEQERQRQQEEGKRVKKELHEQEKEKHRVSDEENIPF